MTSTTDAGRPPQPHYCTVRPRLDGSTGGCPDWPMCIFAGSAPVPAAQAGAIRALRVLDDEPYPDEDGPDEDEIPAIGRSLAWLAGAAAASVVFVFVATALIVELTS